MKMARGRRYTFEKYRPKHKSVIKLFAENGGVLGTYACYKLPIRERHYGVRYALHPVIKMLKYYGVASGNKQVIYIRKGDKKFWTYVK
jgi:hypothetical protein